MSDLKLGDKFKIKSNREAEDTWYKDGEIYTFAYYLNNSQFGRVIVTEELINEGYTRDDVWIVEYETEIIESDTPTSSSDGWIEWKGGDASPIAKGTPHEVNVRGLGEVIDNSPETWNWKHTGGTGDILAYRILEEPVEPFTTDAITISESSEYIGSPTPQNVSNVTVGASVEIKILLDVQGFRFGLSRDEAYKLYQDLQKVFEESII